MIDLNKPQAANSYAVYQYEHVDWNLEYVYRPEQVLDLMNKELRYINENATAENPLFTKAQLDHLVLLVKARLLQGRWEGTERPGGELGVIWVPPFCFDSYNHGIGVWHVKQENNGTSYLASPVLLPFFEEDGGCNELILPPAKR